MAFDFPANPTANQEYTSGGQTFVYTNGVWVPRSAAYGIPEAPDSKKYLRTQGGWVEHAALIEKTSALPLCVASRATNSETNAIGSIGILGVFHTNRGGWTAGATVGGSGGEIIVPRTGIYFINLRAYWTAVSGGRLTLFVNGGGPLFIQAGSAVMGTIEASGIFLLSANDRLYYNISQAAAPLYHASNHTQVMCAMIGD